MPDLQPEVELLGVNFRTAPAAVREALSYDRDQARDLLSRAKARFPGSEALILSTCNRTEFYLVPHANQAMATAWLREVRELRSTAPIFHPNCGLYQARDLDAVRHLFRVASGLESAVLGDVQILAQLREACSAARAAGTFGPWLGEITSRAARLGRSVRSESSISRGAASVGSALAELLRRRYPSAPPDLALLGAGEAGANIAFHLAKRFPGKLQILSRDRSRADRVAAVSGGRSASWDELDRVLSETDVVISALKSPQPVLTTERLRQATAVRSKPLLVIDAGMPRNVEEGWSGEVWGWTTSARSEKPSWRSGDQPSRQSRGESRRRSRCTPDGSRDGRWSRSCATSTAGWTGHRPSWLAAWVGSRTRRRTSSRAGSGAA
ncbi:MAG: hypothetical protein IPK72_13540 [Candidatus Eisenbacteria bacterium]|nr:hypothetical protein [Candidatus Eisenbacteria bacterium]